MQNSTMNKQEQIVNKQKQWAINTQKNAGHHFVDHSAHCSEHHTERHSDHHNNRHHHNNNNGYIQRGSQKFIRATLALFSAGLATFALLYCVQPILPLLSQDFAVSPATSSISLSVSTATLAIGLLFTGSISDAVGRKNVMLISLSLATLFTLITSVATNWHAILLSRALLGLSLSGVAAVAMSWLSEEIHPAVVAFSMGLYISGNSIGGMGGRLITGLLTDFWGWRVALACLGVLSLVMTVMFWKLLPESRHFRPGTLKPKSLLINARLHWRDAGLPLLFIEGFLLMGSFVTLFNYIGYRLMQAPWLFSQAVVGLLSLTYLAGSWSSPRAGIMTVHHGRAVVMIGATVIMLTGLLFTLGSNLWVIVIGMLLFCTGFFAAHTVASGWIGVRARRGKGLASSLYLCFYYLGSSVAGTSGGYFWHSFGWSGVTVFISVLLLLALVCGWYLYRRVD